MIALIALTPLLAASEAAPDQRYAAIFPPGWSSREVFLASAAVDQGPLTFGRAPNIAIFRINSAADREALHAAGAWFILPAGAFRGCLGARASNMPASRLSYPLTPTEDFTS